MAEPLRGALRHFVSDILDVFVEAMDELHRGRSVDMKELRAGARAVEESRILDEHIDRAYKKLMDAAERELIHHRRRDPFKRLIVHPFGPEFSAGRLHRDMLPNYFNFIHLVLGDETLALAKKCVEICESLQKPDAEDPVDWDRFYGDPRAKAILWTVLARIAGTFHRFETRHEWFIGLMEHHAQAVSLASNAFLPLARDEDKPHPFGPAEFNTMFGALFGPLRRLSMEDEDAFVQAIGASPAHVFGDLWSHLLAIGAPL